MAKKNRTCICCGTQYEYCPTCGADKLKPKWYSDFCCEECKDLWETAVRFNMNILSKDEAKEVILGLSLKPQIKYVACIQRDLKNILEEPKKEQIQEVKQEPEQKSKQEPKKEQKPKYEQKQPKASKQKVHEVVEEKEEE